MQCSESSRDSNTCPTVAIVGGGFCGAMTAANLLRHAQRPLRVILIEPREFIGRGLAYSTPEPSHLLNVPCGKMGARPDDIGGFHRWAEQTLVGVSPHSIGPDAFLTRGDYGRYVEAELQEATRLAHTQVTFERRRDRITEITHGERGPELKLATGNAVQADHVILAVGSGPARVPEGIRQLGATEGRLITTPFAPGALDPVGAEDRLLVLGTGLTMFDVAIALDRKGFMGSMLAVSRRGRMPMPHAPHAAAPWSTDWAATLTQRTRAKELVRAVRTAVNRAEAEGLDWRCVIDAMRPYLPRLWQNLNDAQRRRYLRHASSFWEVRRHRCAPQVWAMVDQMIRRGSLEVSAGRVLEATVLDDQVLATVAFRGGATPITRHFDRVLVCAGPETDVTRWPAPWMRGMLDNTWLTPDTLRFGVRTAEDGLALNPLGEPVDWLSIVGPLRKADLWESTAVPELRVQAADTAHRVLHSLRASGEPQRA